MAKMTNAKLTRLDGHQIKFRNFTGRPGKFDKEGGKRTFAIILTPEEADALANDGWNVSVPTPKDESYPVIPILNVKVNFTSNYPPEIYVMTDEYKTKLTPETVGSLDYAEIEFVDVIISPHEFERRDGSGWAANAYLKSLYVKIVKDELAEKYSNLIETTDDHIPFE